MKFKLHLKSLFAGLIIGSMGISSVFASNLLYIKSAQFNKTKIIYNGKELDISSTPMISVIKEGETNINNYMPVRSVLEQLGYNVSWDSSKNSIIVTDNIIDNNSKPTLAEAEIDYGLIKINETLNNGENYTYFDENGTKLFSITAKMSDTELVDAKGRNIIKIECLYENFNINKPISVRPYIYQYKGNTIDIINTVDLDMFDLNMNPLTSRIYSPILYGYTKENYELGNISQNTAIKLEKTENQSAPKNTYSTGVSYAVLNSSLKNNVLKLYTDISVDRPIGSITWLDDNLSKIVEDSYDDLNINKVILNGKNIELYNKPYIQGKSNSIMIPIDSLPQILNIKKEAIMNTENYYADVVTQTITIFYGSGLSQKIIMFNENSNHINVDGNLSNMKNDALCESKDGIIFIPLNALAEAININFSFDEQTKTLTINN